MAIVIEEEKRKFNWFGLALVVALVLGVVLGVYYLFFSPVPLIEKVIPQRVQSIKDISSTDFRPDAILNSETFKILKQYSSPVEAPLPQTPRSNPFLPLPSR